MAIMNPEAFNALICEALGLDPTRTSSVVITLKPQEIPTVEVTQYVVDESGRKLGEELKRCDLVPRPT